MVDAFLHDPFQLFSVRPFSLDAPLLNYFALEAA
jgi:hypothetical protein